MRAPPGSTMSRGRGRRPLARARRHAGMPFRVQAQQQRVQGRVVAGRRGYVVDLGEAGVRDGSAGRREPSWLGDLEGRIVAGLDVAVVLGVPVQAAQGGDEVFGGAASAAGVAAEDDVGLDALGELVDLRWGWFVESSGALVFGDPVPVGAVPSTIAARHRLRPTSGTHRVHLVDLRTIRGDTIPISRLRVELETRGVRRPALPGQRSLDAAPTSGSTGPANPDPSVPRPYPEGTPTDQGEAVRFRAAAWRRVSWWPDHTAVGAVAKQHVKCADGVLGHPQESGQVA